MSDTQIPQTLLDTLQKSLNSNIFSVEQLQEFIIQKTKSQSYYMKEAIDEEFEKAIREKIAKQTEIFIKNIDVDHLINETVKLTIDKQVSDRITRIVSNQIYENSQLTDEVRDSVESFINREMRVITDDRLNELERIEQESKN